MEVYESDFVSILRTSISANKIISFDHTVDWEKIVELAERAGVLGLVYNVIKNQSMPSELNERIKFVSLHLGVKEKIMLKSTLDLLTQCNANGLDCVLIKGYTIGILYENLAYRVSSDSDILVDQKDYIRMKELLHENDYVYYQEYSNGLVDCYVNRKNMHKIELHRSLYEDYEGPVIDILNEMGLDEKSKRIWVAINGVNVRTLGKEEHLVYLLYHTIKHFTLQGMSVRAFLDITLYVNKYGDEINLGHFWNCICKLGYEKFVINFFTVCIVYFGMNAKVLENRKTELSDIWLEQLIIDFIYKGDQFDKSKTSWQLSKNIRPYFVGSESVNDSRIKRKMNLIFPKFSYMAKQYPILKKIPLLLPIVWTKRVFGYIIKERKNRGQWYSAEEKVAELDKRLVFVKQMGAIK